MQINRKIKRIRPTAFLTIKLGWHIIWKCAVPRTSTINVTLCIKVGKNFDNTRKISFIFIGYQKLVSWLHVIVIHWESYRFYQMFGIYNFENFYEYFVKKNNIFMLSTLIYNLEYLIGIEFSLLPQSGLAIKGNIYYVTEKVNLDCILTSVALPNNFPRKIRINIYREFIALLCHIILFAHISKHFTTSYCTCLST